MTLSEDSYFDDVICIDAYFVLGFCLNAIYILYCRVCCIFWADQVIVKHFKRSAQVCDEMSSI